MDSLSHLPRALRFLNNDLKHLPPPREVPSLSVRPTPIAALVHSLNIRAKPHVGPVLDIHTMTYHLEPRTWATLRTLILHLVPHPITPHPIISASCITSRLRRNRTLNQR